MLTQPENAELLAQEQDFDILVMVGLPAQSDEVEQQRERLGEKKKSMPTGVAGLMPSGDIASEVEPCAER